MGELFIGLMSGTSIDGIDAVLVDLGKRSLTLKESLRVDYPPELQTRLRAAIRGPAQCGIDEVGDLDIWVGECFRDAVMQLLAGADVSASDVRAIGSHGQTLRHRPDAHRRFTMQIGNPALIAAGTGIDTVADFRRADLAVGGEGAPLVPPFHAWMFHSTDENRAVVNIGGIANVSVLPKAIAEVSGFDTGPGNVLLDQWIRQQRSQPYDFGGEWAASGDVDAGLLARLLADRWFELPPPKSTGTEYFNLGWLEQRGVDAIPAKDVQATLAEFTATSIAGALGRWAAATSRLLVCGGGAQNDDLLVRLRRHLGEVVVESTSAAGLDPDWVEAAAFAWLARRHIERRSGNLTAVTGASRETVLGALYPGALNVQ